MNLFSSTIFSFVLCYGMLWTASQLVAPQKQEGGK